MGCTCKYNSIHDSVDCVNHANSLVSLYDVGTVAYEFIIHVYTVIAP